MMLCIKDADFESAVEEAAEMADTAPPKYQQAVFQVVFGLMLSDGAVVQKQHTDKIAQRETPKDVDVGDQDILEARYDWSSTKISKLEGVAQYLAVVEIAWKEFKIDGITPKQIHDVLFEKFRIPKTPNAISMTLMNVVGKYVDRIKIEGGYKYRITHLGIEFLRQEEAKV